ncbi:MAG: SUMF1/EgtB/PvdO family nonheme iron enzyme, partial [Clostridia bacterium]|nr:SUMF1/EgtB/PvdO family nonheme iron enzyme [Clostridia bacterium]
DEVLKWLIDTGSKTNEEVAKDSTSWGNYNNATFEYTNTSGGTSTKAVSNNGTMIPTGSTEYTNANNIYDLAGNVWEWTMEASGGAYRNCRGGRYYSTGSGYPAHFRYPIYEGSLFDRRFEGSTLYQVALNPAGVAPEYSM